MAAFRAICLRLLPDSLSARAFPPFRPPSLPSATAAGFFCDSSDFGVSGSPIASSMTWRAKRFGSDGRLSLLERLGISQYAMTGSEFPYTIIGKESKDPTTQTAVPLTKLDAKTTMNTPHVRTEFSTSWGDALDLDHL